MTHQPPSGQHRLQQWHQQLRRWIPLMSQLINRQDWQAMGPLAREVAQQLPELDCHPALRSALVRELHLLKQLHQLAWQQMSARSQELERAMQHMRMNREGLRAYQESQGWH